MPLISEGSVSLLSAPISLSEWADVIEAPKHFCSVLRKLHAAQTAQAVRLPDVLHDDVQSRPNL